MHRFVPALTALAMLAVCRCGAASTFYVAPSGDDRGPGSEARPFATVQRARDEIRRLKRIGPIAEPITVYLRGGTYRLEKTLAFTPEDSGTERAPITYAASAGQHPTISGGRPVTAWHKGSGAHSGISTSSSSMAGGAPGRGRRTKATSTRKGSWRLSTMPNGPIPSSSPSAAFASATATSGPGRTRTTP
jgi:hypothetical protein